MSIFISLDLLTQIKEAPSFQLSSKITLPSSLMECSSSNQEVPGTCHSGSPPNRTFKCHKDKGSAIMRWVRDEGPCYRRPGPTPGTGLNCEWWGGRW